MLISTFRTVRHAIIFAIPCVLMLSLQPAATSQMTDRFELAMQVRQPLNPAIRTKLQRVRTLVIEGRQSGKNVSAAAAIGRQGREAAIAGDQVKAERLLNEALKLLGDSNVNDVKPIAPPVRVQEPRALTSPGAEKTISLPVRTKSVLVTRSVPSAALGAKVTRADQPFSAETKQARGGKVPLRLGSAPIYVVEAQPGGPSAPRISSDVIANSPFGGNPSTSVGAFEKTYADVGVRWIRYAGRSMAWGSIEREKGRFNWSSSDALVRETLKNGARVMFTVKSVSPREGRPGPGQRNQGRLAKPMAPTDMGAFLKFLRSAVDRYDGDGKNDAPGSPIVNHWQIENEVDGHFWGDTAENYARLLKASYKTIKQTNPNARVIIAGAANNLGFHQFYAQIMRALDDIRAPGERYFDILDIHWYGHARDYRRINDESFTEFMAYAKAELARHGYHDVPVWITETGAPDSPARLGPQRGAPRHEDEQSQAAELVRRYAFFLGNGVKKVFWTSMREQQAAPAGGPGAPDYFKKIGLINNPANDGNSSKKLAYFSYRELVRKLEGSDWGAVERLKLGSGVHAYRFTRGGERTTVLWYDP